MLFENRSRCKNRAKEIVCSENKKTYRAFNRQDHTVYLYKIDGDIIPPSDPRNRCDYMLEDETKQRAYLIELKGTQLLKALTQIESTIGIFGSALKDYAILPRIIYHNNTHDIHSSEFRKFKAKHPGVRAVTDYMEENL